MPGPLVTTAASGLCTHAGSMTIISANTRVMASGTPVATVADQFLIAGCPFTTPAGNPLPCVTVRWISPATRVMVNGLPAVLQTSSGLGLNPAQVPQGPPTVVATQPRVVGQ
jgi:uncharacterized Zn-binding protein involved in type VI secretion